MIRKATVHIVVHSAFFTVLMLCMSARVYGQLSPGDLTNAHAHLEGIANCTKCHVLGDKVSNAKCLDCHKEIKSRVDQKKGFHASSEVVGKDCFACHSEHHGRNFDIVRFDTERFNHSVTGYKLTGAHLQVDCKACHTDEHIASAELRKKKETYLGLSTECISCHKDVHQNSLGSNCASCHNTTDFKPAALFDHSRTDFPLKGKHKTVDCKECHQVTIANGELYQKFSGVPFTSCASCHDDVHDSKFGTNCKECHTEESFHVFAGKSTFNHNQTGFPLVGRHRTVDCASCHQLGAAVTAENVFQDYRGKDFNNCALCHKDVHESRLGTDCRQCHSEESFQRIKNVEGFPHHLTDFPLEGKHRQVNCKECHETKMTAPLAHAQCIDCHSDFHKGDFVKAGQKTDCRECHSVEGFASSTFTIERHNTTPFPLTGAHLATPCISCHFQNEEWHFRNIGRACNDCHTDVHDGYLSEEFYPDKTCTQCHSPDAWTLVAFNHMQTGFELCGRHATVSCTSCHRPDTIANVVRLPFTGLEQVCNSCHDNIHGDQFIVNNEIDCRRCHGFDLWKPSLFDHNTARFRLDGAHAKVSCDKCHKADIQPDGTTIVKYRLEKFECINCHL